LLAPTWIDGLLTVSRVHRRSTGVITREGRPLTYYELCEALGKVLEGWDCEKKATLTPAICELGLEFSQHSTYLDKVHVAAALTLNNKTHTILRGLLDEMMQCQRLAKEGLLPSPKRSAKTFHESRESSGDTPLHEVYDSLLPAAIYLLEKNYAKFLKGKMLAASLGGKFISFHFNPDISDEDAEEGLNAFPIFHEGKIENPEAAAATMRGCECIAYAMYGLIEVDKQLFMELTGTATSPAGTDASGADATVKKLSTEKLARLLGIRPDLVKSAKAGLSWKGGSRFVERNNGKMYSVYMYE
jgi:hypothetical protein